MAGEDVGSGLDWKLEVGKQILPHIMKFFGDRGSSQAQEEALKRMMQIATGQYNIQAKQANMDLPLRQDLFAALRNREQERAPRIMPGSFRASNPYERLNRVAPTAMGNFQPSQEGSIAAALMGGGSPAMANFQRSPMPTAPSITQNPLMAALTASAPPPEEVNRNSQTEGFTSATNGLNILGQ